MSFCLPGFGCEELYPGLDSTGAYRRQSNLRTLDGLCAAHQAPRHHKIKCHLQYKRFQGDPANKYLHHKEATLTNSYQYFIYFEGTHRETCVDRIAGFPIALRRTLQLHTINGEVRVRVITDKVLPIARERCKGNCWEREEEYSGLHGDLVREEKEDLFELQIDL